MIEIRFFAALRECLQCDSLQLDLDGQQSVADVKATLAQRGNAWEELLSPSVLVAVNQTMADDHQQVNDGDELALFPPVTGG